MIVQEKSACKVEEASEVWWAKKAIGCPRLSLNKFQDERLS